MGAMPFNADREGKRLPKLNSTSNGEFVPIPLDATSRRANRPCGATITVALRIASPGMFRDGDPLPQLICSRPVFIGGGRHEAGQHGDA